MGKEHLKTPVPGNRKPYEKPKVLCVGHLSQVTQKSGANSDVGWPTMQ
jgi:hypothetical protein